MHTAARAQNATAAVVELTPAWINQLAQEMATTHPGMKAAYARTNAAAQNLASIRSWKDPMARLGGMLSKEEMRAEDGDLLYGIEQELPLFGKPRLARDVARGELSTEQASTDYRFQILRRDLTILVFRTALTEEEVNIGQQDLTWLESLSQSLETRYQSGLASLSEVLTVQNERSRRATRLQTDRNRLDHDHFSLNRLLNREPQSRWPSLQLPPLARPVAYNRQLIDLAQRHEPKLKVYREQIRQAEATVARTRRERLPDVNVGVEGRNYTGDGSFRQGMVFFSLNLPWVNKHKYQSAVRREEARLRETEHEHQDYALGVREEVHELVQKIDAARREALSYREEIIPRSQSALESAQAAWQAGRSSLREVLEANRMLLEARLMWARALAMQYELLSELVLCCGLGDLEALEMIGVAPLAKEEHLLKDG